MVRYVLIAILDNGWHRYEIYPGTSLEKGENMGILELSGDREYRIVKEPVYPGALNYLSHAIRGINFEKERGTVAWY